MRMILALWSAITCLLTLLVAPVLAADGVKIGVLTDMSGFVADLSGSGSVLAANMAVEDFGGAVLGQPVVIVFADHQNKPDIGAGLVRKWLEADNVDAVADVPTSSVGLAVQEITRTK